jgi:hypothetical protein
MLINDRVRTKAIVLVLLVAIYSWAGLSASQAQFAMMQSPDDAKGWKGLVPFAIYAARRRGFAWSTDSGRAIVLRNERGDCFC